jgi:hypothetical protein
MPMITLSEHMMDPNEEAFAHMKPAQTGLTVHPSYRRPDSDNNMPCPEGMSNYPEKAGSAETHDTKISVQPQATGRRHSSNRSHPLDPVGRYHSPPPFSVKK